MNEKNGNDRMPPSLALFCKVVDNYGDAGICWRLARQLRVEHDVAVTLWIDDLHTLRRLRPEVSVDRESQTVAGVSVRRWPDAAVRFVPSDIADIVIEFFGCDIPENYIAAMAQCGTPPVWLNLEGLSAEMWVEGCHTLPSPHPRLPLTKYFFFPGFTDNTGGLLREASLPEERQRFQSSPLAQSAFLAHLGVTGLEAAACKVSLFCYPHAPVAALFDSWQAADSAITCLVPEGVAVDAIQGFLAAPAVPGAARTRGALTVRVLPFVAQPDYDRLLWACDVNFVRGEDSFVRAQWAGKPFVWHIYPQDEDLHHTKLRAFLGRYGADLPELIAVSLLWNDASASDSVAEADWHTRWAAFQAARARVCVRAAEWESQMQRNGEMTANLLTFAATLRSNTGKNRL